MNFKKVFLAVVIAMGITGLTATADAGNVNSDVKVLINGELLAGEKQPVIVNDRTLVPFRAIGEIMGCDVSWDDKTRTAFLENKNTKVAMTIDNSTIIVEKNGMQTSTQIDVAPTIIDNSTYIPARAFAESLGANIGWDGDTRTVTVDYTDFIVRRTFGDEWYITSGGNLMSWGYKAVGMSNGKNVPVEKFDRREAVPYPVGILDDVASFTVGNSNYFAIKNDASLVAWGENKNGILGTGKTEQEFKRTDTPVTVMRNVADIAYSGGTLFALKSDGSLWGWGYDYRLNNWFGSGEGWNEPRKVMEDVKKIEINDRGCAVIKKDDSLWTWGESWLQLIQGNKYNFKQGPGKVMDNVADVSMGLRHYGAVKQDGTLWLCGEDEEGELGSGNYYGLEKPTQVAEDVKDVECDAGITAYITNDGKLVTFGNSYADGWTSEGGMYLSNDHKYILENVIAVKMGSDKGCALTSDGSLYQWGKNIIHNRNVQTVGTPAKVTGGVAMPSAGTR